MGGGGGEEGWLHGIDQNKHVHELRIELRIIGSATTFMQYTHATMSKQEERLQLICLPPT